jgi:hypothetical protein
MFTVVTGLGLLGGAASRIAGNALGMSSRVRPRSPRLVGAAVSSRRARRPARAVLLPKA